jgi:putative oxidoreductase
MKIASTIARYLLGLIFLTFGLNGFLHFIPMPPPTGVAAQFFGALFVSRFYVVIFLLQIVPAVLLLANRYVPLALTILGAVIVNILAFTFSWRLRVCRRLSSLRSCGFLRLGGCGPRLRGSFNVNKHWWK